MVWHFSTADAAMSAARAYVAAVVVNSRAYVAAALAAGEERIAALLAAYDLRGTEEDSAPDGTFICGLWADGMGDPLPLVWVDELGR